MPGMLDDNFAGSVIYLLEHTDKGAMGLVVNRPTELVLSTLFEKIELKLEIAPLLDQPVYYGGPVQVERGFVLHQTNSLDKYSSSLVIADGLTMTTSKDVLEAVASGNGPPKFMMTLGYSGWGAGQLEEEMALNGWMNVPLSSAEMSNIIFDTPYQAFQERRVMHELSNLNNPITALAFDYGTQRIGVAIGNSLTKSAEALNQINNSSEETRFKAVEQLILQWNPSIIVVGLPLYPDGAEHKMTQKAKRFGQQIEGRYSKSVYFVDERYSSVVLEGEAQYHESLDSHAAALILEQFFREQKI